MNNKSTEIEYQKLLKLKKQYTIIVYIGLIFSILYVAFCYLIFESFINIFSILGFFIINYVFMFVIAKSNENKFFKLYDELIVKKVLVDNFANVNIQKSKENQQKIGLINIFNGKMIDTSNFVKCEYKGLPLEIIEAKIGEYEPTMHEGTMYRYIEIFKGIIYCYQFNHNNTSNINIVSKYYLQDCDSVKRLPYINYEKTSIYDNSYKEVDRYSIMRLDKINFQNKEYEDWFSVYADCNINEKKLNDNVLNLLLELRKQVNKKIFIIIQEDMLYIGVNNYYNLYKNDILSKKRRLDDEITILSNHISLVKQIINQIQEEIESIKESKEV